MKILFHNRYNSHNIDNMLFEEQTDAIGDDMLAPYRILASLANNKGIEVGTFSHINKEEADAFVFIDIPDERDAIFRYAMRHDVKKYLLAIESPIINKKSFSLKYHTYFEKVFTWSDDLVASNPQKYVKLNYTSVVNHSFQEGYRPKTCVVISGNKQSSAKNELYSERLKCMRWFNKYAPSDLDIYGPNWNLWLMNSQNIIARIFNKINRKYKFFPAHFKGYKGMTIRKEDILSLYNFNLCLENVYGYNGYITEKILDSLLSGTIPIYKGASNITDYIPQNCFINYDDFNSISDMHHFMTNMSPEEVVTYQKNIKAFLRSKNFEQFLPTTFANTILSNIVCG